MAIDSCEPQVIETLQKARWTALGQEHLLLNGRTASVDIKARRTANGSHQEILLIEVKGFTDAKKSPLKSIVPLVNNTGIQRTVSDNHIKIMAHGYK